MILQRLYELAEREELLADPAFEPTAIPFVIKIGRDGQYLGIEDRREREEIPSKKEGAPAKTRIGRGKVLPAPKAHGNTANVGFACFFHDTLPRVLPLSDEAKHRKSGETFWKQIKQAAVETNDPALEAVRVFGEKLIGDPALLERIRAELDDKGASLTERCTFMWNPDVDRTIIERDEVRNWFREHFAKIVDERKDAGANGFCQITGRETPIPSSHGTRISGIPGGLGSGVSLVSFDKAAFESYGLDGAANACIGYDAADGYTRALNALIASRLNGNPTTSLRQGGVLFVFWTREPDPLDFFASLNDPKPESAGRLLKAPDSGRAAQDVQPNEFYCLCLSGNSARAIVRDYLERPLPEAEANVRQWFQDLSIIDEFTGEAKCAFPIWLLANSTVRAAEDLAPNLTAGLFSSAIQGTPLPDSVLTACLRRLRIAPGGDRQNVARMGLIKLMLNRLTQNGDLRMNEKLCADDTRVSSPGYACGQLLALLARCQSPRDYGAGAQVLERFFGAASTTPRSVFPLLLRLNRHHIRKVREEMPGFATNLEKELEDRVAPFRQSAEGDPDFPAILSLHEQGRFALGFYHQRAAYRAASAEKRAANEMNTD